jgi:hypothetical protein
VGAVRLRSPTIVRLTIKVAAGQVKFGRSAPSLMRARLMAEATLIAGVTISA